MDPGEDGTIAAEPPWVGYADSGLQPDEPTYVLVNAVWRELPFVDDILYENIVMHEVLHPIVGSQDAPVSGDDHSYGTNIDGANSPLLTTYAESYSVNTPPSAGCDQPDGVQECNDHSTTLSHCTTDAVSRYMDDFSE